jgi:hypothetical protein
MRSRWSFEAGFTNKTSCRSFAIASRNDPGTVIWNSRRKRPVRSWHRPKLAQIGRIQVDNSQHQTLMS